MEITCEVKETLAVLKENNGYTKELRLVSWNGAESKLDLHEWKPDGKCGKGFTLTDDEARLLYGAIGMYFNGKPAEKKADSDDDLPY